MQKETSHQTLLEFQCAVSNEGLLHRINADIAQANAKRADAMKTLGDGAQSHAVAVNRPKE